MNIFNDFFKKKGFTAKHVAELLEYSPSYLSKMFNGQRRVPSDFMDRVATKFPFITEDERMILRNKIIDVQNVYDKQQKQNLELQRNKIISRVLYLFKLLEQKYNNKKEIDEITKEIISCIESLKSKYDDSTDELFNLSPAM